MYETKRCTHCGKDINRLYTICPLCGGHVPDSVGSATPICPRCRVPLQVQIRRGEEYQFCPRCSGLWLDLMEFQKATRLSDIYRNEKIDDVFVREPAKDVPGYIPCVRCGKLMNKKNFGLISGVIIDECGRHGVWLDAGEIEKIRLFIADGGLERTQDREIEAVKNDLKDLATKVDQTAFTQKILHLWNFKRWLFGG